MGWAVRPAVRSHDGNETPDEQDDGWWGGREQYRRKGNAVKGNNTVSILCSFFLLKILESGDMGVEWVRRAEALGGLTRGFFGPFRAASCLYT
jgi:hypothetical protein